ncbi:hypothetical protein ACQ4LE_010741 [Meloidogyne hapla]
MCAFRLLIFVLSGHFILVILFIYCKPFWLLVVGAPQSKKTPGLLSTSGASKVVASMNISKQQQQTNWQIGKPACVAPQLLVVFSVHWLVNGSLYSSYNW